MKKTKITSILAMTGLIPFAIAQTTTISSSTTTKATATLSATCTIAAQSVSFGSIMLPLTSQSASSQINVLCNKEAPYTIDLAYGGVYGQGQTSDGSYWTLAKSDNGTLYYLYSQSGAFIKSSGWYGVGATENDIAKSLGCRFDSNNRCQTARPSYDYGIMNGTLKGDSVAYSIEVPGDSSKVWNSGKNSYTNSGTGINQTIPIKAKLVPANSGSLYPAPDMYMDTVTAKITY